MFDTLRTWAGQEDLEDRADASMPYGDVTYADPGYQSDKKKRYPLDSEDHCRAAWSYINMPRNAAKYTPEQVARIKARILAAGKKYGIEFSTSERSDDDQGEFRRLFGTELRAYGMEIRSVAEKGRTLEGHVAVFRSVAKIPDRNGEFEEEVHPGIFDRYLNDRGFPVMQFDHGKDPRTGTIPVGVYDVFEPDNDGYRFRSRLLDNYVVEPLRQAVEARAIKGMSWRMQVAKNGDRWTRRNGGIDKRDIFDADVPEAGPVVFPAYRNTSVSLRSWLDTIEPEHRAQLLRELAEEFTDLTGQPSTRSGGGGETDVKPREGDTSLLTPHERALRLGRPSRF